MYFNIFFLHTFNFRLEIDVVTTTSYIRGASLAMMVFTERTTLYLTILTYVLDGNLLTGDKVFSMAQFFNTIQLYMAIFYPIALAMQSEAKVSIKRIEDFLLLPEVAGKPKNNINDDRPGYINVSNVSKVYLCM